MPRSDRSKKIVRKPFTEALLRVMGALVKLDALARKLDFARAIGISKTSLSNIETSHRNYPETPAKIAAAKQGLAEQFFVNPDYLDGTSELMFTKQPLVVMKPVGAAAGMDFRNRRAKRDLLRERDALIKEQAALKERLQLVEEELALYKRARPGEAPEE